MSKQYIHITGYQIYNDKTPVEEWIKLNDKIRQIQIGKIQNEWKTCDEDKEKEIKELNEHFDRINENLRRKNG
jgi:hypothetical protein